MTESTMGTAAVAELPVVGYPLSEDAVSYWFQQRHGRAPTELELGAILGAMAHREATPPRYAPEAAADGWSVGPSPSRPARD